MSSINPLAYAYAYAYTGGHAYTNGNAYAYSAPMESYGFDGYPGNPLLYASLQSMRGVIRRDILTSDLGGAGQAAKARVGPVGGSLPAVEPHANIHRHGGQVRASMAMLELMSSVEFSFDATSETAILKGRCLDAPGGSEVKLELLRMKRPTRDFFIDQLSNVDDWNSTRDSRMSEILTQVAPPLACFASAMNLQGGRHAKTLELITVALQFGYAVCMRFKHALACPRPSEYTAGLMPVLEVPMHPALPAGHANEAHLTAGLLAALAGLLPTDLGALALRRLAHRIAENRVVAGLHFPVDNIAGRLMGDSLVEYLLTAAGHANCTTWKGGAFTPPSYTDPASSRALELRDSDSDADARLGGRGCTAIQSRTAAPALPVFREMWTAAQKEWQ